MPESLQAILEDAQTGLEARLRLAPTGVVELPLGRRLTDGEGLTLLHRLAGAKRRIAIIGDGVIFVGVGVALDVHTTGRADDMATALAVETSHSPHRRFAVTLPFTPSPMGSSTASSTHGDSPWTRLRAHSLWAPRLSIHQQADGPAMLVVDLGDDDHEHHRMAARADALAWLSGWRDARPTTASSVILQGVVTTPDQWRHARTVADLTDAIKAGTLDKIVLARRRRLTLTGATGPDVADVIMARLQPRADAEVRFLVGEADEAFFGCTPERLCRRRGRQVEVDVLAGTAATSGGGASLLDDDKERREHEAVRRMVHDVLAPISVAVSAPSTPVLRRLAHVQHLLTPVTAELLESAPVFHRLHPTPAVAGVPTSVAVARIGAVEGFDRGFYSGAIGVATSTGEDLYVCLRCAHVHDGGAVLDLYAGSGLVLGSDGEREWLELERKERAMRDAVDAVCTRDGQSAGVRHGAA
jgi:menaquinone-specific isochorismate synthase